MNNKRYQSILVMTIGVLAFASPKPTVAAPLDLYATCFEPPTWNAGDYLLGRDGWQDPNTLPPFLNPYAATITNTVANCRTQSVQVRGADLVSGSIYGVDLSPYDAVGSYRHPLGYTMTNALPVAQIEADLYLGTQQRPTPGEFWSLTIAARADSGETLGEVGLSSQGIFEAFAFDSPPGALPSFTRHIQFNRWYHITMQLDYANQTTSYFLSHRYIGTVAWTSTPSNVLSRASMVAYARPDGDVSGGAGSARANYTARFDALRVSVSKP
jgi:hypothetical protein